MNRRQKDRYRNSDLFPGWKLFIRGFWLLMFSLSVITLSKTRWEIKSDYIAAPLLCLGMYFLLMASIQDMQHRKKQLGSLSAFILWLLFVWGTVTALRGFRAFEYKYIVGNFGGRYYAWTWFVPVLMLLAMEPKFLRYLLRVTLKHGKLGLFLVMVVWLPPLRLHTSFNLLWGCSALLLFWHHLSKGGRRIALLGALLQVYYVVLASSRNEILGHGFLMMAASYIAMFRQYRFRGRRRLGIIFCYLVIFGLVYYAANHSTLPFLGTHAENKINMFKGEIFEDTRTGSVSGTNLYLDFLRDMDTWDFIIGRGSLGSYHSIGSGGIDRTNIEFGYFHIILKGGGIMLFLMLLLAIPAVLKGFFTSRNWVVKGFAFIVLGWLLEMLPFGLPQAVPRYALVWFSIGVCLNSELRKMTNDEIEHYLPEKSV